ncbi:MAG: hypothetical protein ACRDMH_17465 [Solirubrobacterales bacterium]
MGSPLAGALAKVARAEEHLQALDEALTRWTIGASATLTGEKNDERTEFRFYVEYDPLPDPVRWALLIGDTVHNLRAALDHVVYECSETSARDRCEFPIFIDRKEFVGHLYKIRGIKNPDVRALLEAAQPWQVPLKPLDHHLWIIQRLDIDDKHKLLVPVALFPRGLSAHVKVTYPSPPSAGTAYELGIEQPIALEQHALLATVRVPQPAVEVLLELDLQVGVGIRLEGSRPRGVTETLGELCRYTRRLIEQIRDELG